MADAVNAHQRNLYQKKFAYLQYQNGEGVTYGDQLRALSWPVSSDLPDHAQPSVQPLNQAEYDTIHPMTFTQNKKHYETSFAYSYGSFGMHVPASPALDVHDRLYNPSRSLSTSFYKNPVSNIEMQADAAFAEGFFDKAIKGYTQAIRSKASLFVYEKRCAAYAHVGKYTEALEDAQFVLANGPQTETESGPARARVKALEEFLSRRKHSIKGHQEAPATLMCLLTPRDIRQWRSKTPATYTRPYPFGESGKLALTGTLNSTIPKY